MLFVCVCSVVCVCVFDIITKMEIYEANYLLSFQKSEEKKTKLKKKKISQV